MELSSLRFLNVQNWVKHIHLNNAHKILNTHLSCYLQRTPLEKRWNTFMGLTTFLPILLQYCYKYCYDSQNLWAVMKAGGLAL
jgi:hypothetical protein